MKNSTLSAVALLLLVGLTPACHLFKKQASEATTATEAAVEPKIRVLSVNTEEVHKDAALPGSVRVDVGQLETAAAGWDKKTPIVTYCTSSTCSASKDAAKKLKELGFEDVTVLVGGLNEWKWKKLPLEGEAKLAYLEKEEAVVAPKEEEGIKIVSAEELNKRLEEAKK